jgi:hypothetical protein
LQLPGDDSAAQGRFDLYSDTGGLGVIANGGGDGLIDGDWSPDPVVTPVATTPETGKFWMHLRAAGLVPGGGTDTTQPSNAYGGLIGIRDGSLGIAGHVTVFGQLEGPIAKILEARLDDGNPSTGRIQSGISSGTAIDMDSATTGSVSYSDSERYSIAFRL